MLLFVWLFESFVESYKDKRAIRSKTVPAREDGDSNKPQASINKSSPTSQTPSQSGSNVWESPGLYSFAKWRSITFIDKLTFGSACLDFCSGRRSLSVYWQEEIKSFLTSWWRWRVQSCKWGYLLLRNITRNWF